MVWVLEARSAPVVVVLLRWVWVCVLFENWTVDASIFFLLCV